MRRTSTVALGLSALAVAAAAAGGSVGGLFKLDQAVDARSHLTGPTSARQLYVVTNSSGPNAVHSQEYRPSGAGALNGSSGASSWKDPYPDLPAANDPAIARADCGTRGLGEFIGSGGIRYRITAPLSEDSSKMPLLVQNDADHCGMGDSSFVTLNVFYPVEDQDSGKLRVVRRA